MRRTLRSFGVLSLAATVILSLTSTADAWCFRRRNNVNVNVVAAAPVVNPVAFSAVGFQPVGFASGFNVVPVSTFNPVGFSALSVNPVGVANVQVSNGGYLQSSGRDK